MTMMIENNINDTLYVYLMYIVLFILYLSKTNGYGWVPLLDLQTYNTKKPSSIQILNNELVIWEKNNDIIVQQNACMHRKAPLSEGYIDKESNNLRCSYHGWEFDTQGVVKSIPQSNCNGCNVKLKQKTYQTIKSNNILWINLNETEHFPNHVSIYNNTISDDMTVVEVPYNINTLLENLFDPAHVPFAHHNLQSTRDLASDVNVTLLNMNSSSLEILFEDRTLRNGGYRNGTMCFYEPSHFLLTSIYPLVFIKNLHIYCVPINEYKTRVFVQNEYNNIGNLKYINFLYGSIPHWMKHVLTQTFLDSDTMLLHKQEQYLRNINAMENCTRSYTTPTTSDKAIHYFHKWKRKYNHFKMNSTEHKFLTRQEVFNRYDAHTKNCKYCTDALNNINILQVVIPLPIILYNLYDENTFSLLMSVVIYYSFNELKTYLIFRDYVHNELKQ